MKIKRLIVWFAGLGLMSSCSQEPLREIVVTEVSPLPWNSSDPAYISYTNVDTLRDKTIDILVRFRNDFAYDRFDLILETLTPDSLRWRDTLSVQFGQKETIQATSLTYTDIKTAYRSRSLLRQTGIYRFKFIPAMAEHEVDDIIGVGLEITTH